MIGFGRLQCHTSVAEIGCLPNRKTSAPCWWPTRSLGHCHPMESSIRRAEESNYQRHCETTPSDFLRGSQEQQKMEKKLQVNEIQHTFGWSAWVPPSLLPNHHPSKDGLAGSLKYWSREGHKDTPFQKRYDDLMLVQSGKKPYPFCRKDTVLPRHPSLLSQ